VVNALSEHVIVEVARGQQLYRQEFRRGKPATKLLQLGKVSGRRGTLVRFKPTSRFSARAMWPSTRRGSIAWPLQILSVRRR